MAAMLSFRDAPLSRRILLSVSLFSLGYLGLLTLVLYFANERLADDLLEHQIDNELQHILTLLELDPEMDLPQTAGMTFYLTKRPEQIPKGLRGLKSGEYRDIIIQGRSYHARAIPWRDQMLVMQYEITDLERVENKLAWVFILSWLALLVMVLITAVFLSRKLSQPLEQLSEQISQLSPEQRGLQLTDDIPANELGKIAASFNRYLIRMDEYVEKQNAFAAMASHELRSPLTVINTSADLLDGFQSSKQRQRHVDKIQSSTRHLASLVHALLQVTRDKPVDNDSASPLVLHELIENALKQLEAQIQTRGLIVKNLIPSDLHLSLNAVLLEVVVENLLRNAVRHSSGTEIQIVLQQQTLIVQDTGDQLLDSDLNEWLKRGVSVDPQKGYGMGLYISQMICDHQGWQLQLLPNPDRGLSVCVQFTP